DSAEKAREIDQECQPRGRAAEEHAVSAFPSKKPLGNQGHEQDRGQPEGGQKKKCIGIPAAQGEESVREIQHAEETREEGEDRQEYRLIVMGDVQLPLKKKKPAEPREHGHEVIMQKEGEVQEKALVGKTEDAAHEKDHEVGRQEHER